ncbi:MAG TPA: Rrf2 family transcriptional regulator [Candidatus Acidoferrales bacterium]|nr:Rrf2 family transcriptional regulator [Candidatus Acidoferrales bacterium]
MLVSRSAEYAIRAMTCLARQSSGTLLGAREISQIEKIPMPFLGKVLQNLARLKLVRSFKGVHGGYELARPARQITLQSIVTAMDGNGLARGCVFGLGQCNEKNTCPLHAAWAGIRAKVTQMLEQTTIADLARAAAGPGQKEPS